MPMSVTVTKFPPVLVGPATAPEPAAEATVYINLSSFDRALAFFPVTSFHVFDRAIGAPAETVRGAMSRALVHYFPVAGRIVAAMENALVVLEPRDFAFLDITVPSSCIDRIKAGFAGQVTAGGGPCTVFEAVMAVLWQCRTRAVMPDDPSTPAPLIFAANVRKHAGARHGYYGNCITSAVAVPTSGEVAHGGINDVVRLIKRAKQPIPHQFKRRNSGRVAGGGGEGEGGLSLSAEQAEVMFGYNAFDVTSWRNLGADAVDLGGGTPARVMCRMDRMPVPHCVACLPCRKDGANVLARCVKEEHVDAFLGELAKFT